MKWMNCWIVLWIACFICLVVCSTVDAKKSKNRVHGVAKTNSTVEGGDIYSPWTRWSRCSRRCMQKRTRRCVQPTICDRDLVRELRVCKTKRCLFFRQKTNNKNVSVESKAVEQQSETQEDGFQNQIDPYSEWSQWSSCSEDCISERSKTCLMPVICGKKVKVETIDCNKKLTHCHRLHRNQRKRHKSGDTGLRRINPIDLVQCGMSPVAERTPDMWKNLRIIGGREVRKGSWPWQLALLNQYREPFCGATLIAPEWALTAAHCLRRKLIVRSGEHNLMSIEDTEQESPVKEQFVHPDYDEATVQNDIALLRLRSPFSFDNHTQAACLPLQRDFLGVDSRGIILGWGKHKSTAMYGTDTLHQAEVPIVDPDECQKSYDTYPLTERVICAGYKQGRIDSCAGDSGGPLLVQRNGKWTLFGVTSFGDGCGEKGKFGIYSSVPKHVKWIRRVIFNHSK